MSDLAGGRATNGGARTGGPVPVPSSGTPSGVRTPRQIMRDRTAREQQRAEEQKAEEQRRLAEERRRSAERRAAAVGGAAPRFSQASQYSADPPAQYGDRMSGGGQVAGSEALGNPTSRSSQVYPDSRTRGPSVSQQEPRPAQATSGPTRRSQQEARQSTTAGATSQPQQSQTDGAQQRAGASSFPHAFERWETLSSHWEGLTSYWLHKLEQNTSEIQHNIPNAVTLNRQITDLSAAGANLFHAVVELQRLRASSERKFQRWFFESKNNEEKLRENHAQVENQLKLERNSREDAARQRAESTTQVDNARREVAEMRRELMIAKDEARRAWEELGRRNQDHLETAQSLKDGRVTLVGGVQVVPYFGGPSRTGSVSQRPTTRDTAREGQQQYGTSAAGLQSHDDEGDYYPEENSPTNTDPFMESSKPQSYQTYDDQRPAPASAGSLGPPRAPVSSSIPMTTQEAQRFYQHAPQETFLHSSQSPQQAKGIPSEASYVESEDPAPGTEYAVDPAGNVRYDDHGRPIVFRRRVQSNDTDDSYDVGADIRREREHAERYGRGEDEEDDVPPEAPSVPATSAQAMASYGPEDESPDYEGEEYAGWEDLHSGDVGRHHHPTRLSDVLEEEDDERSSRRTGEF